MVMEKMIKIDKIIDAFTLTNTEKLKLAKHLIIEVCLNEIDNKRAKKLDNIAKQL
jgi:hypothetical protein